MAVSYFNDANIEYEEAPWMVTNKWSLVVFQKRHKKGSSGEWISLGLVAWSEKQLRKAKPTGERNFLFVKTMEKVVYVLDPWHYDADKGGNRRSDLYKLFISTNREEDQQYEALARMISIIRLTV